MESASARPVSAHAMPHHRANQSLPGSIIMAAVMLAATAHGGDWLYWKRQTGSGHVSDVTEWTTQAGSVSARAPGAGDEVILRGPGTMQIDSSHLPSGVIASMWVGDGSPTNNWPYAPIAPGAGNVLHTSGTVQYSGWFIIGRAGAPGESTYDMQGGKLLQAGTGAPFVLANNAGYGSARNPTRGTLTMSSDATISHNNSLWVGEDTGSVGTLVMRDTARFEAGEVRVGLSRGGTGIVTLTGSATLTSRNYTGMGTEGGAATVTMSGSSLYAGNFGNAGGINGGTSTWTLNDDARIAFTSWFNFGGSNSFSRLTMNDRSSLKADSYVDFGWGHNTDSRAVLNGSSSLTVADNLNVGIWGQNQGMLTLNDQSTAVAGNLTVGSFAVDANGAVALAGSATLNVRNYSLFGQEAGTASLTMRGNSVVNGNYGHMGGIRNGGSSTITLVDNSRINFTNWFNFGEVNATARMTLSDTARITANSIDFGWGLGADSQAVLNGDSSLVITQNLNLGVNGANQGFLTLHDRAAASAGYLNVGTGFPGATGTLTLNDSSTVTIANGVNFGGEGGTGNLVVNGGRVATGTTWMGYNGGHGSATINSGIWAASGPLNIGMSGGGDATLAVNGGQVTSTGTTILGADAGSSGTVTISAGNWTNAGAVRVGDRGTGSITVGGGTLDATTMILGNRSGGSGTVTISGGTATVDNLYTGFAAGATGSVTVDGGTLTSRGLSLVGVSGSGSLTINSGTVNSSATYPGQYVGFNAGSSGTVTVRGGLLDVSSAAGAGLLVVGNSGTGRLNLEGGRVNSDFATIGSANGSLGTAVVTDGVWANAQVLAIGSDGGSRGSLTIDGGTVNSGSSTIVAQSATSQGDVAVHGGSLDAGSYLYVGLGGNGSLAITAGTVSTGWAWIGATGGSTGSTHLNGGTMDIAGALSVGDEGSGSLHIDGGQLTNWGDTLVGEGAGGSGFIAVTGGTLTNWGAMRLGGAGSATLDVRGSGIVEVLDALEVGPGGNVTIGPGGQLYLGWSLSFEGNPPVETVSDASVSGDIAVDGRLVFARASSMSYAGTLSGTGEVVQAGDVPVTFTGNHTFSGRYMLSSGSVLIDGSTAPGSQIVVGDAAMLGGAGLIGGATTVNGTVSAGRSPGVLTFADDLIFSAGSRIFWELAANSAVSGPMPLFDQFVVNGDLAFAGSVALSLAFAPSGSTVDWSDSFWETTASWTLFDVADGRATLGIENLAITLSDWLDSRGVRHSASRRGSFFLALDGNDVKLVYSPINPVPEPGTGALAVGCVGMMAIAWHRRRAARRRVGHPPA